MVQIKTSVPEAHVTVNRNRIKQYGNSVYLKSGTNFEIEIFNPKTSRISASIEIDGRRISSSDIVINPGQRIYLERWIENPRKFLFSTYEVENTQEVKDAIAQNGRVKVSFHDETVFFTTMINNPSWTVYPTYYNYPSWITTTNGYGYGTATIATSNSTLTTGTAATSCYFSSADFTNNGSTNISSLTSGTDSSSYTSSDLGPKSLKKTAVDNTRSAEARSLETGRAEQGESSSQSLDSTYGSFYANSFHVVSLQILPESQKPIEASNIRAYCPNCGTRIRSASWKFCSSCGEKL